MLGCSGIGTYLRFLIEHLQSAFRFILITKPDASRVFPLIKNFSFITCKSPIYSLQEQVQLPRIIPKCDLFWSPHFNAPLLPIRAKKRLITLHDVYHLAHFSCLKPIEKIYVKTVMKQGIYRADHIVTASLFSQSEICKYLKVSKSKISMIPLGIKRRNQSNKISSQTTSQVKEKYSLPDHFFLFVGNIKPHKNLAGAVAGYQQLNQHLKNKCPLFIIGQYQGLMNKDPALDKVHRDKRVHFLGALPDDELFAFYRLATALVFPSFYEGFGFPPLEAMSSGCPTIISRIPCLEEVCADAAYYINPSKPETITKAMHDLITNNTLRTALTQKGKARVKQFNWTKTADSYNQLITAIMQT
ncbi:MAG: glycosyltransferase family 1 protein [Chlamydiota bacterium]